MVRVICAMQHLNLATGVAPLPAYALLFPLPPRLVLIMCVYAICLSLFQHKHGHFEVFHLCEGRLVLVGCRATAAATSNFLPRVCVSCVGVLCVIIAPVPWFTLTPLITVCSVHTT